MKSKVKYIDLSHTIEDGTLTYKGLPAPIICDYLNREESKKFYEDGTTFQIGKIEMVANTGTYLDCPFHRYEDGKDLSEIALNKLVDIPGIKISVPYQEKLAIDVSLVEEYDVNGKAVLFHTDWSAFWNTDRYFEKHPFLTKGAANFLKENGAVLVGIDSHNIDDTSGNSRPVHSLLLKEGILIVEHMTNLHSLPASNFYFTALPPKFKGVGTFPVRALAKLTT